MARFLRGNSQLSRTRARSPNRVQRQSVRLLRKLPNRNQAAQRDQAVDRNFHDVSAFFFRLNQQPVSGSLSHAFSFYCEDVAERCFCLNSLSVIIAFEHWMRGRVESDSK